MIFDRRVSVATMLSICAGVLGLKRIPSAGSRLRRVVRGRGHVFLEGGAGGILVLHDGGEYERRGERHREGVGHNFIVPLEGVFADVSFSEP